MYSLVVLLEYLTESSVSPLQAAFVEVTDPLGQIYLFNIISFYLSLYLSIILFIYIFYVYLHIYVSLSKVSIYRVLFLSIYLSIYLSMWLFIYLLVLHISASYLMCLVYPSLFYPSNCLSKYLSIYPSINPSQIYFFIFINLIYLSY